MTRKLWLATIGEGVPLRRRETNQFAWKLRRYLQERIVGFKVERVHSLQQHYARTLKQWLENLEAAKDKAIALTSQEVYDTYIHYLTGCSKYFRSGHIDVCQFTLAV